MVQTAPELAVRRAFEDFLLQHGIANDSVMDILDYTVDAATSADVDSADLDEMLCGIAPTWASQSIDIRLHKLNVLQSQVCLNLWHFQIGSTRSALLGIFEIAACR